MRRWLFLAAMIAGIGPGRAASPPPPRPKLIVAISIDQYAADLFDRYRATYTGGLARLAGGMAFSGYQSHAATETCPGHSTILTGRHPAATGIVANEWIDRATGRSVYCVSVPGHEADEEARGPQNLKVDTLGDWLKRAEPAARVVTVSGKDRAAIMMAGHHADAVYWWQDGKGFTTSSFAGPATPAVLAPAAAFDTRVMADWASAPPALWPDAISDRCRAMQAPHHFADVDVSGRVPTDLAVSTEQAAGYAATRPFQNELRASPLFDKLALDFAGVVLDQFGLGRGPATDLLAISLSANDYVGHRYGNGGAEMCALQAGIDQRLGAFFARLDTLAIPYVVVLTADHGGSDAPERAVERGIAAKRFDGNAAMKDLNAHLRDTLSLASGPFYGDYYLRLAPADAARRDAVLAEAVRYLRAQPYIDTVALPADVARAAPPRGKRPTRLTMLERMAESYDPVRSGDLLVANKPGLTSYWPKTAGLTLAGHGSPWDYDRRVPILFWWPGIAARDPKAPIETVDIAPTLAAIAAIPAPLVDGRCLKAVTRCR